MTKLFSKLFKVYQDEISLFLWSSLLLFLIRSSNTLFNNFAETAFLKRFGVEYLPMIFMVNSVSTFFIMGFLTGIMARVPGNRMLSYMLMICGGTVAVFRFIVPLGIDMIYPVLYVLKSQYEVLLGLLFWNMANDLFNTRQSKRIFPLITAGGVMGGVIGSFGTPVLVRAIAIDNLMWAYLVTTVVGALVVRRMGTIFPTMLPSEKKAKKVKKKSSIIEEFKKIIPLIKESDLVKVLILLTFLPNVVIPIINFQFNYAIDQTYATEKGMIEFFSYFRGAMNMVSFVILLFIGKVYGRWGLPVALMFHPFNYILAFLSFLFSFNIWSAMYARLSTTVLRTTMNNPARAILMGLFPPSYRSVVRPFLRGTVVRIGTLLGSGFIIVFQGMFHPRFLSIIAVIFVSGWVLTSFILKKRYSRILLDLISRNMLDLKSMEEGDVSQIFQDKKIKTQLVDAFLSSKGSTCIWYADLMKSLRIDNLDTHILSVIRDRDDKTRIGLLGKLSSNAGEGAIEIFDALVDKNKSDLTIATLKAAVRLPPEHSSVFLKKIYDQFENPEINAHAIAGLYRHEADTYGAVIDSWLSSNDPTEKRAGIIAGGWSKNESYREILKNQLEKEEETSTITLIIEALHRLETENINEIVSPYFVHSSSRVRKASLEAFHVDDDDAMRMVITKLGDETPEIQSMAKEKLHEAPYENPILLIESLAIPNYKVRKGIFSLLESLEIKDVDIFRFARGQMENAYINLAEAEALKMLDESVERDLLIDHVTQEMKERLDTVMRVLATQDDSGQMRVIWRGLFSSDSRQRSNALEALEDSVGRSYSSIMVPLLEGQPPSQCLDAGKKVFQLPDFSAGTESLFPHLLDKEDWVTIMLGLYYIDKRGIGSVDHDRINNLSRKVSNGSPPDSSKKELEMEEEISIPDKILHLRSIQIFEDLSVSEMAAIASVTEETVYPEGNDVIKEGEQGDTMYMIISGCVGVITAQEDNQEIELDQINKGDYFGEMALFEDLVRSATIRTKEESRLLVLHKREFTEIVREYPQIALHICKVLSQRLRKLHERVRKNQD